jgi:hypothetical protein
VDSEGIALIDKDGRWGPSPVDADDGSWVETVWVGRGVGDVPPVFDEGGVGCCGGGE